MTRVGRSATKKKQYDTETHSSCCLLRQITPVYTKDQVLYFMMKLRSNSIFMQIFKL